MPLQLDISWSSVWRPNWLGVKMACSHDCQLILAVALGSSQYGGWVLRECPSFRSPRLPLFLHSIWLSKSQGWPRFKERASQSSLEGRSSLCAIPSVYLHGLFTVSYASSPRTAWHQAPSFLASPSLWGHPLSRALSWNLHLASSFLLEGPEVAYVSCPFTLAWLFPMSFSFEKFTFIM